MLTLKFSLLFFLYFFIGFLFWNIGRIFCLLGLFLSFFFLYFPCFIPLKTQIFEQSFLLPLPVSSRSFTLIKKALTTKEEDQQQLMWVTEHLGLEGESYIQEGQNLNWEFQWKFHFEWKLWANYTRQAELFLISYYILINFIFLFPERRSALCLTAWLLELKN